MTIVPYLFAMNTLSDLVSGGTFTDSEVHLYQSDIALTPRLTAADMDAIEADYTGYAAVAITGDPPGSVTGVSDEGDVYVNMDHAHFSGPASGDPQTIIGAYWTTDGGALIAVYRLPTPKVMASLTDVIIIEPRALWGQPAGD